MSDLLGDTQGLRAQTVSFNAVHSLPGPAGAFAFKLSECPGLAHLLGARAIVEIVSDSLTCQVIGPASASKAVSLHVAVVPFSEDALDRPSTADQVMTIPGSTFVQHSLYVGAVPASLGFAPETAHQLKPTPVHGEPPMVVGHCTITGGTGTDAALLKLSGVLSVQGIGYVRPWSS
jgi:hypothetical protein